MVGEFIKLKSGIIVREGADYLANNKGANKCPITHSQMKSLLRDEAKILGIHIPGLTELVHSGITFVHDCPPCNDVK